jgi:uncharacterized membrane protein (Fun14 family)
MPERDPMSDAFGLNRALTNGMLALRVAAMPLWLGGLLMSISDGCGSLPMNLPSWPKGDHRSAAWLTSPPKLASGWLDALDRGQMLGWALGLMIALVLTGVLVGLLLLALNCWAQTGFIRLHRNILEHASDELAPLFSGKDRFWSMLGYKLLAGFSTTAAAIVAAWPGALIAYVGYAGHHDRLMIGGFGLMLLLAVPALVYVALGAYLGELSVVLEGASPAHALRRAFALARGNRWPLLLFAAGCGVLQLASVGGLLLCCVGVLATVPLARALCGFAKTESFLLLTRGHEQAAGWKLWQRQAADAGATSPVQGWGEPPGKPPPEPPQQP